MTAVAKTRTPAGTGTRRSLWLQEALALEGGEPSPGPLRGAMHADVCVVGGGYTGLWTAIRLKEQEPASDVVLVEADVCGGAASGRNGGFALSWWPKTETMLGRMDADEARRMLRASDEAITELGRFCEQEGIDCQFHQGGWLWTATSPAQVGAWQGAVRAAERLGAQPFELLSPEQVRGRTGSPVHLGGVLEPSGATVQPALLARGLRRAAKARGVRIFERSPMRVLERSRGIVTTPEGSVTAPVIVLAINAWAAQVRELRRAIVPLGSDVVATEPVPGLLEESGWTGGESISNSRLMVHYYRTTRDGRIAFGRGGGALGFAGRIGPRFEHAAPYLREAEADMRRLVPAVRGVAVTHTWSGAVDRSEDGLPFFGALPGAVRIVYGVGFSGNGVAPSVIGGRILASLALQRDDEWAQSGLARGVPGRFPPEPLRYLGGLAVRGAVARKEKREDHGRPVDPLTRRLAALAPSGFFKVSYQAH
jgi:putative aminophosphonate oxidoreductase